MQDPTTACHLGHPCQSRPESLEHRRGRVQTQVAPTVGTAMGLAQARARARAQVQAGAAELAL